MVLSQSYSADAAQSSQSGAGKIFPTHYIECRLALGIISFKISYFEHHLAIMGGLTLQLLRK